MFASTNAFSGSAADGTDAAGRFYGETFGLRVPGGAGTAEYGADRIVRRSRRKRALRAAGAVVSVTMTEHPAEEDFSRLADPYRRELMAHCYRMLGSVHDAEDLVQETYLRAWRAYDRFEGRSSLRTWLHRIATSACLTALEKRGRRPLPTGLGGPSPDPEGALDEGAEVPWLEPVPDAAVGVGGADPGAVVVSRESVRLAFIAALQHLPPRQRAVLLLRDVLKFRAAEVAEVLGISIAAVNSLLQRARTHLDQVMPCEDGIVEPAAVEQRELLDRYVAAFEAYDISAIVELFSSDAVWEMPPFSNWVRGAENIGRLTAAQCPAEGPGDLLLMPSAANGQPAFGVYMRGGNGEYRPFHLQALTVASDGVSHVAAFFDTGLFPVFGLPQTLPTPLHHPSNRAP